MFITEEKEKNKLLSVIVPAYNVEDYIERCVDSIITQLNGDCEVILVDDGSTDSTGTICDAYSKKYANVVVIHKENGGLSEARNVGISFAQGEYISLIDGDDYVSSEFYDTMLGLAKNNDADVVVCNYKKVFENELCNKGDLYDEEIIKFSGTDAIRDLFLNDRIMNYAWNKLYKRYLFQNIEYPVGKLWEDILVTYRILRKSEKVVYTNRKLYFYLQRSNSITAKPKLKSVLDQYELLTIRYNELKDDFPDLKNTMKTQLCTVGYNCWSFIERYGCNQNEYESAEKCIDFLNKNGKKQLKNWQGFIEYKYKVILYFYCKFILKTVIWIKKIRG